MRRARLQPVLHFVTALALALAVVGLPLFQHTCRMMEDCGTEDACATVAPPMEIEEPSCCAEEPARQEEPSLPSRTQVLPEDCCKDVDLTPARSLEAPALSLPSLVSSPTLLASLPSFDEMLGFGTSWRWTFLDREDPSPPGRPRYLTLSSLLI